MAIFATDILIRATAYVEADTAEDAAKLLATFHHRSIEMQQQSLDDDLEIDGSYFSELSGVTLSPAMTIYAGLTVNYGAATVAASDFEERE